MSKSFAQMLVEQVPRFDEIIIQDMGKPYLHILPRDVRLLPNTLRKLWAKPLRKTKRNRKRFRMMRFARDKIEKLLEQRLEQWLKRLPKRQSKHERKIRTYPDGWLTDGWIGNVSTTAPPFKIPQDRFKDVWKPVRLKKENEQFKASVPATDGSQPASQNGAPHDPWAAMNSRLDKLVS